MSLAAIFVFAAVSAVHPAPASPELSLIADDRTPIRCKPAPYYVAEQGVRSKAERLLVTGSRVPLVARDFPDRRARPCFLMRYETPNPLRPAD